MAESTTAVDGTPAEPEHEWSWFIRAKLAAPVHQVRLVSREHLLERLDRLAGKRLGLIVAPAGFGIAPERAGDVVNMPIASNVSS